MSPLLASPFLASADFGAGFYEELVALAIIVGLFAWKAWPFLRDLMAKRQATIGAQLSAGEDARAQAAALVESRRAALEVAITEAGNLVRQAQASAERLRAEGERRSAQEYERLVAKAGADLGLERARQRDEVVSELSALVIAGATRVVEAELDAGRQHRLIAEAIAAAESEVAS